MRQTTGPMCAKQLVISTIIMALALLLFYAEYAHCATVPQMNNTDMLSLVHFSQAISDPKKYFSSWKSSIDYCNWKGITCSQTHPGRVMKLNLTGQNLGGQIPPSLGNLTFLRVIDLSSNTFFGQFPVLNRVRKLKHLDLNNNQLQEFAPGALRNCSNLLYLDLSTNNLASSIPPDIGILSNLQSLYLGNNNFTGVIPSSLYNISQLEDLQLFNNNLEGNIPEEIGRLSKLTRLFLFENRLSDSIPSTILNHSSLNVLDVHSNFLSMALPSTVGNTLPNIAALSLNNNNFHGSIPASLGNAPYLQFIYFHSNSFTGHIPSSLGKLSFLTHLIVDNNKLEANDAQGWEFLDALGNCTSLGTLSLSGNRLQGSIPNSIGKLFNSLEYLGLGINNLSGIVPESIGNLTYLTTLYLGENNLTGPIGSWAGKLKNLGLLNISYNNFSGPIPSSFGSFAGLTNLYLQNNKFDGPIPPNLTKLQVLDFSYNNLQGFIPKDLFGTKSAITSCILSYNNLDGPIPREVSNLQQITELHLSSNKLNGEIPVTLGDCPELLILQMDSNSLSGNIPKALESLKSLNILNLSHNNLSGFIPKELGSLSSLTHLDLSYNDLQGEIPRDGVFGNATVVSLVGNSGLCGGVLDLHRPSYSRRIIAKYYLIGVLIPIFGFISVLMLIYFGCTKKQITQASTLSPLGDQFPVVSYKDLAQATQNFSESHLIGRGSYGSVYKGNLDKNKLEIAVKVLDLDIRGAEKSFLSECEALRNIRHRNLVPILTACSKDDINGNRFRALIYEFMPKGNLDSWLHKKANGIARKPLGLFQRICLAVNIADVLDYLHHEIERTIIHCDVKPSNILLDNDMNAHLGDFGIANFHPGDSNTIMGTIGYIAPEYARGGHASTSGDVYSFGVVLLEMLIGKRPTDHLFFGEQNIVSFVESNFPEKISNVVDPPLQKEVTKVLQLTNMVTENWAYKCLFSLLQLALSCTREYPGERPTMWEAASRIKAIKTLYVKEKTCLLQQIGLLQCTIHQEEVLGRNSTA